jgi:Protein of unknown function (DUF433)
MEFRSWRHSIGRVVPRWKVFRARLAATWVFRGTRLPVATVIENLEDLSVEEVMAQFDVSREQIAAVLDFVAESLRGQAPANAHSV